MLETKCYNAKRTWANKTFKYTKHNRRTHSAVKLFFNADSEDLRSHLIKYWHAWMWIYWKYFLHIATHMLLHNSVRVRKLSKNQLWILVHSCAIHIWDARMPFCLIPQTFYSYNLWSAWKNGFENRYIHTIRDSNRAQKKNKITKSLLTKQ